MENSTKKVLIKQKQTKKYQLVVELSLYQNKQKLKKNSQLKSTLPYNSNTNYLPKIVDIDERQYNQESNSIQDTIISKNIFKINPPKNQQLNPQTLNSLKQYEIVGLKQINSYKSKLLSKKKNVIKKVDSMLSLSRLSISIKSQHDGKYLNKDDLINIVVNDKHTKQLLSLNQTEYTHKLNSFNHTSMNPFNSTNKSKDKFDGYVKLWNQQKQKKPSNFPSVINQINQFRTKMQTREAYTLNEKKQSINEQIWVSTLRTNRNVQTFYDDKFIQKIINADKGLNVKGKQKLQKEIEWIEQKDKNGFMFSLVNRDNNCLKNVKSMNSDREKECPQNNRLNTTFTSGNSKKQRIKFKAIQNKADIIEPCRLTKVSSPSQFSHFSPSNPNNLLKTNRQQIVNRAIRTQQNPQRKKYINLGPKDIR